MDDRRRHIVHRLSSRWGTQGTTYASKPMAYCCAHAPTKTLLPDVLSIAASSSTERRPNCMCRTHHRHSIFCILPPHVLREIAMNGTAPERTAALDTLATDQTFRAMRADDRLAPKPSAR